ncbi:hypothetical protein B5F11_09315 [Anaerotruncus colihominis]|uniref:Uncharacterized protein n=1 Tax=Anaerotruncus colihominis TaxID=169435 RepID=A0A1Y4MNV5_9FIRM|nr:hypothetical protein B5F11_09315 [Anaerotruncus colihominis]
MRPPSGGNRCKAADCACYITAETGEAGFAAAKRQTSLKGLLLWYNNRPAVIIPSYGQGDTRARPAAAPMADYTPHGRGDARARSWPAARLTAGRLRRRVLFHAKRKEEIYRNDLYIPQAAGWFD